MTHDYKAALDALNKWNCIDRRLNHKAREFGRDKAELFLECNLENLRSALHLAQEHMNNSARNGMFTGMLITGL